MAARHLAHAAAASAGSALAYQPQPLGIIAAPLPRRAQALRAKTSAWRRSAKKRNRSAENRRRQQRRNLASKKTRNGENGINKGGWRRKPSCACAA